MCDFIILEMIAAIWEAKFLSIVVHYFTVVEKWYPFNPKSALKNYCKKILLHIYFCTHSSVLNLVFTTSAGEKFRLS